MPTVSDTASQPRFSWRPVSLLAGVLSLRMLGLFMVLPVLALYAAGLPGATPLLAGLAVGAYGVTQALLQIPFGSLSDRLGRLPVILAGLGIFAAGSVLAALADSVWLLIAGRALQGAGAISSAVIALVADLTPAERRTRAMAVVGVSIGGAFSLALMLGPLLAGWLGVPGLFWITAGLALAGGAVLARRPALRRAVPHAGVPRFSLRLLGESRLLPLFAGVFLLHALMTALFVALPGRLLAQAGLAVAEQWRLYLPALAASLPLLPLLIRLAEGGDRRRELASVLAMLLLGLGLALSAGGGLWQAGLALALFFGGFNFLEAGLPARLTLLAGAEQRGAALGVYATCQFLGAFAGALAAGALLGGLSPGGVLAGAAGLAFLWLIGAFVQRAGSGGK